MLSVIGQIFRFMRVYRKFWMAPILLGIIALGGVLVLAEGSAVAYSGSAIRAGLEGRFSMTRIHSAPPDRIPESQWRD